jgi:protein SCO1
MNTHPVTRRTALIAVAATAWAANGSARAHGTQEHAATTGYKRSTTALKVPDVVLTDYNARPVVLRQLLASPDPVMLNFVFTTCTTICPVMSKVFAEVPARLGRAASDLRMISISIDPEHDTPLQLKAYARSLRADERWVFLTGGAEDVKSVLYAFGAFRGDKMNHEPVTLMRSAWGKEWLRIDGFASPDELTREYRKLNLL